MPFNLQYYLFIAWELTKNERIDKRNPFDSIHVGVEYNLPTTYPVGHLSLDTNLKPSIQPKVIDSNPFVTTVTPSLFPHLFE